MSGVTIITCTHVSYYAENIFDNYSRQKHTPKELILILNSSNLDITEWQRKAEKHPDVSVFFQPEHVTVGSCMNFAVKQAKYDYIANFDHDDYYGAKYLEEFLRIAPRLDAGLFGKKTHYVYAEDDQTIALMHPGFENTYVDYIDGPTMFMKKSIFDKVSFIDNDISDCQLSWDCTDNGIKIYSLSRDNFAYIRRKNTELHTWKIECNELLRTFCTVMGKIGNYRSFVDS